MYSLLFLLAVTGPMRCGDLLVAPGATTLEVRSKCGEPQWRERVSGRDAPVEEVWIYATPDSGAQKLLHFEGVTLSQIRSARSGAWSSEQTGSLRCRNRLIAPGDTKFDASSACGEPDERRTISASDEKRREIWMYLRDGKIVELEFEGVELRRVDRDSR